jgi:exosortase E/protease (VPEID-CTERM system)
VRAARLLVPVVLGAGMAGALVARGDARAAGARASLPVHSPWPGLVAHLGAFALTAAFGWHLLGPGAPPPGLAAFVAWLCCVATTVALAATIALPPRWLLRVTAEHVQAPLLAAAAGLLVWRGIVLGERLWPVLQGATLRAAAGLLAAVSGQVVVDAASGVVGLGDFAVSVAPECSGADGIGLVVIFQSVWIAVARPRLRAGRAVAVLLPVGACAALVANALRIAALVALGGSGHEALALSTFHSKAGWFLFAAIAFATVAAAERLPWLQREGRAAGGERSSLPDDASAQVAPYLAAVATALATSLWAEDGLDRWYAARILAALAALAFVRRSLAPPSLPFSWLALALGAAVAAVWIRWGGSAAPGFPGALARLEPAERAVWLATRVAGSIAVIPLAEELAFRGFLLPWLARPHDEDERRTLPWFAIALSSAVFGATHEHWMLGTVAGAAFAAARLLRGRLSDAVLAHAVANAGVTAAALVPGRIGLLG